MSIRKSSSDNLDVVCPLGHIPPRLEAVLDGEILHIRPPLVEIVGKHQLALGIVLATLTT